MYLPKPIVNYIKEKEKNSPIIVTEIASILRRSGRKNYSVFFANDQTLVLLDTNRDVMRGIITKGKDVVGFKNSDDLQAVVINAYARYKILNSISANVDLERAKEIFKGKRTWIIHSVQKDGKLVSYHTHGMENYSHPNFRFGIDIGEKEIMYLFNSLCRSVQRGNVFENEDVVENLYDNYKFKLLKSEDGFFDIELVNAGTLLKPKDKSETAEEDVDIETVTEDDNDGVEPQIELPEGSEETPEEVDEEIKTEIDQDFTESTEEVSVLEEVFSTTESDSEFVSEVEAVSEVETVTEN